jgi:hydroxymethylpyrimidine/phosphomethylpyrimidine kinase
MIAQALTIAGSDSSGGAGIQADLKTFSALGVYGASVITSLTAQNTKGVQSVFPAPREIVKAQLESVLSDLNIKAIKTGMLANDALIKAVVEGLKAHTAIPLIVDPVMVSQSGHNLLEKDAIVVMREKLLPLASLLTPNLHEAAKLTESPMAQSENEMALQGRILLSLGAKAVLVKGGHAEGTESVDIFVDKKGVKRFTAPRVATKNTHGTGCALSSAIAAFIAQGLPLNEAIAKAKIWLSAAIAAADELNIGRGEGPVHHFHALWPKLEN